MLKLFLLLFIPQLDQALIDELQGKLEEYGVICAEQENAPAGENLHIALVIFHKTQ